MGQGLAGSLTGAVPLNFLGASNSDIRMYTALVSFKSNYMLEHLEYPTLVLTFGLLLGNVKLILKIC